MRAFLATICLCLMTIPAMAQREAGPDSVRVATTTGYAYVSREVAKGIPAARFGTFTKAPKSRTAPGKELSLAGFPGPLVAKVRELEAACGARVISAFRPGAKVFGTNYPSLHASKRAIDLSGNPRCLYARLRHWPGGVSTDYARVAHVHISYAPDSREWGARFAHYIPRKARRRAYGG